MTTTLIFKTSTGIIGGYAALCALSDEAARGQLWHKPDTVAKFMGCEPEWALAIMQHLNLEGALTYDVDRKEYRLNDGYITRVGGDQKLCDVCRLENKTSAAIADAKTSERWGGRWANLCITHFIECGCTLGTGRGQFLRRAI